MSNIKSISVKTYTWYAGMNREDQRIILIILIAASLIGAFVILVANQDSQRRINYYESPRGVLERALNRSADREYNETLMIHNTRLAIGLVLMIILIGSIGLFRDRIRNSAEEYI